MPLEDTIASIVEASSWAQRVARLRLVPQRHGIGDHIAIYAAVARQLYLPALSPDFAYLHPAPFYEATHFDAAYAAAFAGTAGFTGVTTADIARTIAGCPATLLVFRTILGLGRDELAHATKLFSEPLELRPVSKSSIQTMEETPTDNGARRAPAAHTDVLAGTIQAVMKRTLFGAAPEGLRLKQDKADTEVGWASVRRFATEGVPLATFLHQRHYGGAFRQLLDATSGKRGDVIEDEVEALFSGAGLSFIKTGAHNQAEIAARFEITVTPAPDFVVFDSNDTLLAMLECKGASDGGTARDKASRFARLRTECVRLGGTPLFAVLGGIGWARINDALAPVIRDTEGRVFTLSTLHEILDVPPFAALRRDRTA